MKRRILLCTCLCATMLTLYGCNINVGGTVLEDYDVIWAPLVAIWHWLWRSFTAGFWAFVKLVWELPLAISWLAGPIVYVLGLVLYIALVALIIAIILALGVIIGIFWFIIAIFNGIFHFV